MLTNGTHNDTTVAAASDTLPDWAAQLDLYSITIENRQIARFGRVGGDDNDHEDDNDLASNIGYREVALTSMEEYKERWVLA